MGISAEKGKKVYQETTLKHSDPWVNLLLGYVTGTVEALIGGGLRVERSWLDPCGPRDATILYSSPAGAMMALVWDEVTGWRHGSFLLGQQGVRTELAEATYLGGGVLPDNRDVTRRVIERVSEPRRLYRSADDLRDGLDDALRHEPGRLRLTG